MESSVACELWNKALLCNTRYTVFTGDDDSTTLHQMEEKVSYDVKKWSDIAHTKRSLTTRLYNTCQQHKFNDCSPLTQKVINYLTKCFSYCIAQNKRNPSQLKKSLSQIISHSHGDHTKCSSSWCKLNDHSTTYTHKDFRYGKDLHGEKLKKMPTELCYLHHIHDEGTKLFMENFYDEICKETSVCEALRRTMSTFQRHENNFYRSFKVWAPFTNYFVNTWYLSFPLLLQSVKAKHSWLHIVHLNQE